MNSFNDYTQRIKLLIVIKLMFGQFFYNFHDKENPGVRIFRQEESRRSVKKHFRLRGNATEISLDQRKNIKFFSAAMYSREVFLVHFYVRKVEIEKFILCD